MLKYGLSFAALLAAHPALAQEDDQQIIVTAAGIAQPRDEVGQAVTVIDAETIQRRQPIDVVDLLATTPGVRFSRTGTIGSATGVSLRGAETTQTLVLIDGVKVNDPSGIGDAYDFGPLLTGNIRRIEILRGSNSVVYGSQAIGGVVNLMTAVPVDGFAANASAEHGYSDTWSAKADVSGSSGIAAGGIGATTFTTAALNAMADSLLDRNMATGTDSGTEAIRTARQSLRVLRNKVDAGLGIVYKEDDTTVAYSKSITTDPAADPIVEG